MLSWHPATDTAQPFAAYTRGFRVAPTGVDMHAVAQVVARHVWSDRIWRGGRRHGAAFVASYFCVLDFETPDFRLADALETFCDCAHVIGTTKSHGKGGLDRFRVVIPWAAPVTSAGALRASLAPLERAYGCDPSGKDAARGWYPCRDVVSVVADGFRQATRPAPPPPTADELAARAPRGTVSPFAAHWLAHEVPEGQRTVTVYRVAADLARAGWTKEGVRRAVVASPTYRGAPTPHAAFKINEAIDSAWRKVEREQRQHER